MTRTEDLFNQVAEWASAKGILDNSTPEKQLEKTVEEVAELIKAIASGDKEQIALEAGDVLVTLVVQAAMIDELENLAKTFLSFMNYFEPNFKKLQLIADVGHLAVCYKYGQVSSVAMARACLAVHYVCKEHGLYSIHCLELAIAKITKRTGKMVDGIFVKD